MSKIVVAPSFEFDVSRDQETEAFRIALSACRKLAEIPCGNGKDKNWEDCTKLIKISWIKSVERLAVQFKVIFKLQFPYENKEQEFHACVKWVYSSGVVVGGEGLKEVDDFHPLPIFSSCYNIKHDQEGIASVLIMAMKAVLLSHVEKYNRQRDFLLTWSEELGRRISQTV